VGFEKNEKNLLQKRKSFDQNLKDMLISGQFCSSAQKLIFELK
jgi:hypothetical protein